MKESIILIGPMGTGKSTIANILSEKTNMPIINLDDRTFYPQSYFLNPDTDYRNRFYLGLVDRITSSITEPSIMDFGASHTFYKDPKMLEELKRMLTDFHNVVLILPSSDKLESLEILNKRRNVQPMSELDKINWEFLNFEGNEEIATIIVYTNNKTPEEVSTEILDLIKSRNEITKK